MDMDSVGQIWAWLVDCLLYIYVVLYALSNMHGMCLRGLQLVPVIHSQCLTMADFPDNMEACFAAFDKDE